MSYPILAKLPEHLNQIKKFKENTPKLILSALLWTEEGFIHNSEANEKQMIDSYINFINSATDHDGDCVKQSAPCVLCHSLDSITIAEETLDESKIVLNDLSEEDRILRLIEVLLATQPEKKFNSEEEMRKHLRTIPNEDWNSKYHEIFDYEDDIVKRIAMWEAKDEKEKQRLRILVKDLLSYTKERLI